MIEELKNAYCFQVQPQYETKKFHERGKQNDHALEKFPLPFLQISPPELSESGLPQPSLLTSAASVTLCPILFTHPAT